MKTDVFDELCTARGWVNEHQRALNLGVSHTTLRRLRVDGGNPGGKLIAAALNTFGVTFEYLFERRSA
jgi:hypothetical protein